MSQLHALLHELSDGRFHSGRELGEALGVSRAAVWKTLRKAPDFGLELHCVKGKGYRLPEPLELLEHERLLASPALAGVPGRARIQLLLSVDSTNTHVMNKIRQGELDLTGGKVFLCLAERQTAGRGRRGRPWVSPFGHNLYFTLARSFNSGAAELEGLSLVTGLALIRVLNRHGARGLQLKWPNDLYCRGRKLGGILLEITGDLSGECQLLVGIGLNLRMPAVTDGIDQPFIDLASILPELPGRNRLAGEVAAELIGVLDEFERQGFSRFQREWLDFDMLLNKPVQLKKRIEDHETGISGVCRGVNEKGAILLETAQGLQAFHAGELSVRLEPAVPE